MSPKDLYAKGTVPRVAVGGTFTRWNLVGESLVIGNVPLRGDIGTLAPFFFSLFAPAHHEVTRFPLLWAPTMMFCPATETKAMEPSGHEWKP